MSTEDKWAASDKVFGWCAVAMLVSLAVAVVLGLNGLYDWAFGVGFIGGFGIAFFSVPLAMAFTPIGDRR